VDPAGEAVQDRSSRAHARMTLRRMAGAMAATLLAAMSLAGCGGGDPVNTGPFGNGGGVTEGWCSPAPLKTYTAGGIAVIGNSGPAAVIDAVRLDHLRGLRLLATYVVPQTGRDEFGDWNGIPSPRELPLGVQWSKRQRAQGARIPPEHGLDVTDLVLVVRLVGKVGSASGIDVYYHTADGHYHLHLNHSLELVSARICRD
jgi:hypothetical protein